MSTNLLVFQMLHYAQQKKTYNELLTRAESIFPSSQICNNFKSELKNAFHSQQSLDDYEFALDTFENLKTLQTSPVQVEGELANITSDPRFSAFTEIATLIDMPYSDTMFVPTVEIAEKISEETFFQPDLSMMAGIDSGVDADLALSQMPKTDKVVLNVTDFGITNSEALFTSDGFLTPDKMTTTKIEEAKANLYEAAVNTAQTINDVNIAIDAVSSLNEVSLGVPAGDQDFATSIDSVYTTAGAIPTEASEIVDSNLTTTIAEETSQALMFIEEEKKRAGGGEFQAETTALAPEASSGASAGLDLGGPCQ